MRVGTVVLGFVVVVSPAVVHAEGLAIDHRTVGCVVAGKYPRLNACFAPASRIARARVYFRVADAAPDWYYVEMASSAPCHAGVLPRPRKELVGRRIQYYVDALDREFAESRTREAEALVVSSASECEGKLPVAPVLKSATVAVFPSLPAGFAGAAGAGLGGAATAVAAVGGAGVVGGGVALASGGSDAGGETTSASPPPEPPAAAPAITTTTTTTLPPAEAFAPVMDVLKGTTLVTGDSVAAAEPLTLTFDMCRSTGPYPMRFGVHVDGVQRAAGCRSTLTFTTGSVTQNVSGSAVRQSVTLRTYAVVMTIRSEGPNNKPKADRELTVQVGPPTTGSCSGDTQGPMVMLKKPIGGTEYPTDAPYPVHFEADVSDATTGNNGVALVQYKLNYGLPDQLVLGPAAAGPSWALAWSDSEVRAYLGTSCSKDVVVKAYAQDGCGNSTFSSTVQITVKNTGTCVLAAAASDAAAVASATLVSELGVPGGAGQVVANGEAAFPRSGRIPLALRLRAGENEVEATLVEARSGGTWRFDLGTLAGLRPGTLRVVAGDVVQIAPDSVTFRMHGRPGERVVFAFRAAR